MAQFFRGAAIMGFDSEFKHPAVQGEPRVTPTHRNKLIKNYWGENQFESRFFSITVLHLEYYFDSSSIGEVAIRITNIENKDAVEGIWMPFSGEDNISIEDKNNPNVRYYIFERDYFDVDEPGKPKMRLYDAANAFVNLDKTIIAVRLGKDLEVEDKYYVFFNLAVVDFKDRASGGIGNGGSAGNVQIPIP